MAALVRYLSDGQFTQLGQTGPWTYGQTRAAMRRFIVIQLTIMPKERFRGLRKGEIDHLPPFTDLSGPDA